MKPNITKNLLLLFITVAALMLASCSDDGKEEVVSDKVSDILEGTWTSNTVTIHSITVDGKDISVFLEELRDQLVEDGTPEEQIEPLLDQFEEILTAGFEDLEGPLTFIEDGGYEISSPSGIETGTWELTNNDQTLILDRTKANELEMEMVLLTATDLVGHVQKGLAFSNQDETNSHVAISVTFVLTR